MISRAAKVGGFVVLVLSILYFMTAARTVGPGDSGELTSVMVSWGVAHPPGYPLLTLLGNLVHRLPFPGEPAFPLNLLSALFGALAAGVLAMAVARATRDPIAGALSGLALGVSRLFWEYSLVVEVFSLNALFGALLLYFLVELTRSRAEGKPALWTLPAIALTASQALTHHLTLVLLAVPVILAVLLMVARPQESGLEPAATRRALWLAVAAGLVGLLPLVYLPIASASQPVLAWGEASSPTGFIRQLLRSDYGSGTLMSPWGVAKLVLEEGESIAPTLGHHLLRFWMEIPRSLGWLLPALSLAGFVVAFRDRTAPWRLFLTGWLGMVAIFFLRVNSPLIPLHLGVTERFYILHHVVLCFLAGLGMAALFEALRLRGGLMRPVGAAFILVVAVVAPLLLHGRDVSMASNRFSADLGYNFTSGLPDSAFLLSEGDLLHNAFYYQQLAMGRRPDVEYVDLQKLTYDWYVRQIRRSGRFRLPLGMTAYGNDPNSQSAAWLAANTGPGGHPVAAVSVQDVSYMKEWNLLPQGLWWLFQKKADGVDIQSLATRAEVITRSWKLESLDRHYHERSWEVAQRETYWRALAYVGALQQFADDLKREHPGVGPTGYAADLRQRAEAIAGPKASSVRALEAEMYQRLLVSGLTDFGRIVQPGELAVKMVNLAEEAVAMGPTDPLALARLADLLRADPLRWSAARHLELCGRLVDAKPGDEAALGNYVQLVIDGVKTGQINPSTELPMALARQKRHLALVRRAAELSDEPTLILRLVKWEGYLKDIEALAVRLSNSRPGSISPGTPSYAETPPSSKDSTAPGQ
ncbi:MAG: DUF2723 domain-containing protein [Candidatus Eisenbacteria bacterium]|nr:DUF2723 domain-containing protein [Candidatus Eisenbacteria bacterium]